MSLAIVCSSITCSSDTSCSTCCNIKRISGCSGIIVVIACKADSDCSLTNACDADCAVSNGSHLRIRWTCSNDCQFLRAGRWGRSSECLTVSRRVTLLVECNRRSGLSDLNSSTTSNVLVVCTSYLIVNRVVTSISIFWWCFKIVSPLCGTIFDGCTFGNGNGNTVCLTIICPSITCSCNTRCGTSSNVKCISGCSGLVVFITCEADSNCRLTNACDADCAVSNGSNLCIRWTCSNDGQSLWTSSWCRCGECLTISGWIALLFECDWWSCFCNLNSCATSNGLIVGASYLIENSVVTCISIFWWSLKIISSLCGTIFNCSTLWSLNCYTMSLAIVCSSITCSSDTSCSTCCNIKRISGCSCIVVFVSCKAYCDRRLTNACYCNNSVSNSSHLRIRWICSHNG